MTAQTTGGGVPSEEICTQPACLLRAPEVDRAYLAELLGRMLTGEDTKDLIPEGRRIEHRDACATCVMRVLDGARPFPTEKEVQRLSDLGHWSYRRQRRR